MAGWCALTTAECSDPVAGAQVRFVPGLLRICDHTLQAETASSRRGHRTSHSCELTAQRVDKHVTANQTCLTGFAEHSTFPVVKYWLLSVSRFELGIEPTRARTQLHRRTDLLWQRAMR